ncbi:hypothetical protein C2L65_20895 [Paraburkholderia terrae]|uniref:Uncharacterized protein n=1 Tax=Paraburkholderia terrae TaxID=311230 RepID=A0A2I8ERA1_9BURK|nr:hypothetical protein C2L65_20895 [Paraburkholderia terrae]
MPSQRQAHSSNARAAKAPKRMPAQGRRLKHKGITRMPAHTQSKPPSVADKKPTNSHASAKPTPTATQD